MTMSRTRKLLSLSLVTASLGVAGMTLASPGAGSAPRAARSARAVTPAASQTPRQPATPLLTSTGRPACGNTLGKPNDAGRRAMLTANLAALADLVNADNDQTRVADRDALIEKVRKGLAQLEACDSPEAATASTVEGDVDGDGFADGAVAGYGAGFFAGP